MRKNKNLESYSDREPTIPIKIPEQHYLDPRQISIRWLLVIFLTGLISSSLIGMILLSNGQKERAKRPEFLKEEDIKNKIFSSSESEKAKGRRLFQSITTGRSLDDKRKIELSTKQNIGGREIIRTQDFELVNIALAEKHTPPFHYPQFNTINLFSDIPESMASSSQIYGRKIETEMTLRTFNFPISSSPSRFETKDSLSENEVKKEIQLIKKQMRKNFSFNKDVQIVQENVTILTGHSKNIENYSEEIIPLMQHESISNALHRFHYNGTNAQKISDLLKLLTHNKKTNPDSILHLEIESNQEGVNYIIRANLYEKKRHILSIALNDQNQYIQCDQAEMTHLLKEVMQSNNKLLHIRENELPIVYDAIFQSVLASHLTQTMATNIIRILAHDVDMQSRISSSDSLQIFYPLHQEEENNQPEILYISAQFRNKVQRYYRFQSSNGKIDYYDSEGRNPKKLLMRKPVPNGVFSSPFGARRHPILGYVHIHTGVDWAASRGSPILAAGDGVVTKAEWSGGYGYRTEIQHENGYSSSYSHQTAFAAGIKAGEKVYQGQIIGYVGSSGLSTGPHCHFEIAVNETKVDPMHVQLPHKKSLIGKELKKFQNHRDNIDNLIKNNIK
ncbi:MAG: membrane protein [Candidatus Tokpelaia sp. JSC161]|jgi:murein DD-endopeptidase MepM/ murein hydrolase activator NlpD|nr:MAG: membrane protein [Candidatus Tokpelaia sp. JSC161]